MASRRHVSTISSAGTGISTSAVVSAPTNQQLQVYSAQMSNQSGSTADLAILRRFGATGLKFYTYNPTGPVATDVTATINAGTNVALAVVSTNDTGFVVQASEKFGLLGFNISVAAGASTGYTFDIKYWNGTTYAALTTIAAPTDYTTLGANLYFFSPPNDWVTGGTGGVDSGKYSLRMLATTAGSDTPPSANSFWVASILDYSPGIANKGKGSVLVYPSDFPLLLNQGDGIQPYFGVVGAKNMITVTYSISE